MEEMLIIPKKEFQGDVQQYKEELTSNALLNQAGQLAAKKKRILNDPTLSDDWKVHFTKPISQQLRQATKKLRQIPSAGEGDGGGGEDDDEDLVSTSLEKWLKRLAKSVTPRTPPVPLRQALETLQEERSAPGPSRTPKRSRIPRPTPKRPTDTPTTSRQVPPPKRTLKSSLLEGAWEGLTGSKGKKGPVTRSRTRSKSVPKKKGTSSGSWLSFN